MIKEQFIASVSAHFDELNAINKIDNFYDYEGEFIKLSLFKRGLHQAGVQNSTIKS